MLKPIGPHDNPQIPLGHDRCTNRHTDGQTDSRWICEKALFAVGSLTVSTVRLVWLSFRLITPVALCSQGLLSLGELVAGARRSPSLFFTVDKSCTVQSPSADVIDEWNERRAGVIGPVCSD